jgi:hypothetical protein
MAYHEANSSIELSNALPSQRTQDPWIAGRLALLAVSGCTSRSGNPARIAAGYISHVVCSYVFVSGLDPARVNDEDIAGAEIVAPATAGPKAALDRAFAEPDGKPVRRTHAVVIVHDGRVVAKRHAEGFGIDTPVHGWSATKSVNNALLGILVQQGKLKLERPAPVAAWQTPGDPRRAITPDHLLRMHRHTSGAHSSSNTQCRGSTVTKASRLRASAPMRLCLRLLAPGAARLVRLRRRLHAGKRGRRRPALNAVVAPTGFEPVFQSRRVFAKLFSRFRTSGLGKSERDQTRSSPNTELLSTERSETRSLLPPICGSLQRPLRSRGCDRSSPNSAGQARSSSAVARGN